MPQKKSKNKAQAVSRIYKEPNAGGSFLDALKYLYQDPKATIEMVQALRQADPSVALRFANQAETRTKNKLGILNMPEVPAGINNSMTGGAHINASPDRDYMDMLYRNFGRNLRSRR